MEGAERGKVLVMPTGVLNWMGLGYNTNAKVKRILGTEGAKNRMDLGHSARVVGEHKE